MARILVTGSKGFIGAELTRTLWAAQHDVVEINRSNGDIVDEATWQNLPPVEHVYHLAGRSYVPGSWVDPSGFVSTNTVGTARALDYCRRHGAHLVFLSAYLYGTPARLPVAEDDCLAPNNPYALSKFLAESLCAFYATIGVPLTVIRPFNVFGPGQRREFLIPTIIAQLRAGHEIRVRDLAPRRDYILVDDLVAALIAAIKEPRGHRTINIGSGVSYSVREMIDLIQTVAGTHLPVTSDEVIRHNEISDVRADITRARLLLGWTPTYSFAQGIERILMADSSTVTERAT